MNKMKTWYYNLYYISKIYLTISVGNNSKMYFHYLVDTHSSHKGCRNKSGENKS